MALISKPYTFSAGSTIVASEHNSNFDTLYNEINGSLSNANISASAAITDSKLAQLTTAGKVSGASLTLLTSLPSGAGLIPTANLGSGTATSAKVLTGDQTWSTLTSSSIPAGTTIQTQYAEYTTAGQTAVAIPQDNTIPQSGEGAQLVTVSITPSSASNILIVEATTHLSISSATIRFAAALFQDSTADALSVSCGRGEATANTTEVTVKKHMVAGTTSATTFKLRVGAESGTLSYNRSNDSSTYMGGVLITSITVREIKV